MEDGEYPKVKGKEHTEMLSGLIDYYNPSHANLINRELDELGGEKELLEIDCVSINDVLDQLSDARVDYLSIDTEGSEFQILKTIHFEKFNIEVIGLEVLYPNSEISRFMKDHGYELVKKLGYDLIYRKCN